MILPDFILHSRVNARWDYSGMDSIEDCFNKKHFKNYPHTVKYVYNSRGFRDAEWPESIEELKNAIWCIGDSFTVGLGSPLEHTWPYLLQQQTGRRCINVSMDGASNDWIARKTQAIIKEINPTDIVIMWSYTHRRENKNLLLSDESRRIWAVPDGDIVNFTSCLDSIKHPGIKHCVIPEGEYYISDLFNNLTDTYNNVKGPLWPQINNYDDFLNLPNKVVHELKTVFKLYDFLLNSFREIEENKWFYNMLYVKQLDYARDYNHFDKLTSQWLVEQIS